MAANGKLIGAHHRFTYEPMDLSFVRELLAHTLATTGKKYLRGELDRGEVEPITTLWVNAPDGVEWTISYEPSWPRYFTVSTAADLESYREHQARKYMYFENARRFAAATENDLETAIHTESS
ncbi:hypothetical protein HN018_13180 [Lichenicola cladoniae]|uniref:Uncharacterized protein n=1 Tax=Lichenicola cladoniae TaxID=1484109 RepID=A0A6M8HQY1_9PROT|nr:hypothetical protein [Lichenicola cladoniae]NPD69032.1 hypothetical protein [Acetobacteraceae bacterium]QKE90864.1 hypothetical protein HN018_13180 [Lichenicola cladoniae]